MGRRVARGSLGENEHGGGGLLKNYRGRRREKEKRRKEGKGRRERERSLNINWMLMPF